MKISAWGLALGICLLTAGRASAHALGAECRLKGGKVEVEAYYDDDTAASNARVTVLDAGGKTVAEGRTNDEGHWAFAAPPPGQYQVVVDAGDGHRTKVKMTVPPPKKAAKAVAPGTLSAGPPDAAAPESAGVRISAGPSRAEFIRVPWLKIALGLVLLGGAGLAAWIVVGRRRAAARGESVEGPSPVRPAT